MVAVGEDVAGAHGDDAHAHAGSGHAGCDGPHGAISARGDDDGGSFLKGAHGLPGARILAGGLAPVYVVDAHFFGLTVDELLECLGVPVLRGVHDDPGARPSARWIVHGGGDREGLAAAVPAGDGCCEARDPNCAGSGDGGEYPRCSVHVNKGSPRVVCGWIVK